MNPNSNKRPHSIIGKSQDLAPCSAPLEYAKPDVLREQGSDNKKTLPDLPGRLVQPLRSFVGGYKRPEIMALIVARPVRVSQAKNLTSVPGSAYNVIGWCTI